MKIKICLRLLTHIFVTRPQWVKQHYHLIYTNALLRVTSSPTLNKFLLRVFTYFCFVLFTISNEEIARFWPRFSRFAIDLMPCDTRVPVMLPLFVINMWYIYISLSSSRHWLRVSSMIQKWRFEKICLRDSQTGDHLPMSMCRWFPHRYTLRTLYM